LLFSEEIKTLIELLENLFVRLFSEEADEVVDPESLLSGTHVKTAVILSN